MTDRRNNAVPFLAARLLADRTLRGAGFDLPAIEVGERFVP